MIKIKQVIGLPTLQWHLDHKRSLTENVYRYSSKSFLDLFTEARQGYNKGLIELQGLDKILIEETQIGQYAEFEGETVPLDLPMINQTLLEAEYQGRDVDLNEPKRGGSKAYYVYVNSGKKTKDGEIKAKKVSFGSGGLKAKLNDKEARNAFAKRHDCKNKKDKTKPGYWSCRLPRYAKQLGMKTNYTGFW